MNEINLNELNLNQNSDRELNPDNKIELNSQSTNINIDLLSTDHNNDSQRNLNQIRDLEPSKCSVLIESLQTFISNKLTFVFIYFFLLILFMFILNSFDLISAKNFSLSLWTLKYKKQYYRLLTHHFIHSNIVELLFNMTLFYYFVNYLERKVGTLYLMVYISNSLIWTSLVFYSCLQSFNYILINLFKSKINLDGYSSFGFSSVIFNLIYLYYTLHGLDNYINILELSLIKSRFMPFLLVMLFYFVSPNTSIILNVSGIISGMIFKDLLIYLAIPNKLWILHSENVFKGLVEKLKQSAGYIELKNLSDNDIKVISDDLKNFPLLTYFTRNNIGFSRANVINDGDNANNANNANNNQIIDGVQPDNHPN